MANHGPSLCSCCGMDFGVGRTNVTYACESCYDTQIGTKPWNEWRECSDSGKNYDTACAYCFFQIGAKWQSNATVCHACYLKEQRNLSNRLFFLKQLDPSPLSRDFKGDISFIVDGGEPIQAHRFVLAGKSPVFRKMLEVEMREKISGTIRIAGTSAPVLRAVVNYLYTTEINFSPDVSPLEVFKFAHTYDIPWLKEECGNELAKMISTQNLTEMLRLSCRFESEILKQESRKFFVEHPDTHLSVLDDLLKDL